MTKRERQYTNWVRFWSKRKPIEVTVEEGNPIIMYSANLTPGRIRVPDTMLKKMGRL